MQQDQDSPDRASPNAAAEHDQPSPLQDNPLSADHVPGSVDPETSEPQVPRLGEGGASPGAHDPSLPMADEPVTGAARAEARGPAEPVVGAGRAVEAAYRKNRPLQQQHQRQPPADEPPADEQQESFQGAGYPVADMDGPEADPEASPAAGTAVGPGAPADPSYSEADDMVSDGARPEMAPPESGPAEEEPEDTSIIGAGHVDKAAWNRERTSHPQPGYDAVASAPGGRTPGSAEDMGYGGGAPNEDVPGLDTGDGVLDELTERAEVAEDETLEDAADALDDDTDAGSSLPDEGAPGSRLAGHDGRPDLPEHRFQADEGIGLEDRLIADENEDAMFAEGEMGLEDDLEMEELNEVDDISRDFEDQRVDLDDSASGNERQAGI